jgi:hypothetical protein
MRRKKRQSFLQTRPYLDRKFTRTFARSTRIDKKSGNWSVLTNAFGSRSSAGNNGGFDGLSESSKDMVKVLSAIMGKMDVNTLEFLQGEIQTRIKEMDGKRRVV